jgi:hypothetical protein
MNPFSLTYAKLKKLCQKHGHCRPHPLFRWKCLVTQPDYQKAGSCVFGMCKGLLWPGVLPDEYRKEATKMIHKDRRKRWEKK